MNPGEFIQKWKGSELSERSACQQHFLDLCDLLNHPKPADVDKTGETFTFEKGAEKHTGGEGWADVWKKGFFGWEYKKKHADLNRAYDQLLNYREALENPPLLVVCDMDRIIVRTNFTGTATDTHEIALKDLGQPRSLEILRAVFHDPDKLKPGRTSEAITQEAASRIGDIAQALRDRGLDARSVAHFLDRIVFCLFAEDIGLLPEKLFARILEKSKDDPVRFAKLIGQLFDAMANGGDFGMDEIRRFNGNLFTPGPILDLTMGEIESIRAAATLDWSAVDPSIFGTLFVRGMDPAQRAQLGAQYTSRQDIETLVEPVVMAPLRREWNEIKQIVENLLTTGKKKPQASGQIQNPKSKIQNLRKARGEAARIVQRFLEDLSHVTVLDPACGSANFLYVTLQKLKDLEKEAILYASQRGLGAFLPFVNPKQLYGIEISPYAHELAQMTIWIGYLQWTRVNGFGWPRDPVLEPMDNIACKDAILDLTGRGHEPSQEQKGNVIASEAKQSHEIATRPSGARDDKPGPPTEPDWPTVDFIVGNPPFLGGSKIWEELGRDYQEQLWEVYKDRVPGFADLCCYWFEKARTQIEKGLCRRAGLLATQGIRGGANREVLKRIKETGDIFFAESDRPWILDGANVHISMVGFDDGSEKSKILDGQSVQTINPNLSSTADITKAVVLKENQNICYIGTKKAGPFDVDSDVALDWLQLPNPNGRPTSDVLVPWLNGEAITKRVPQRWIIDAGVDTPLEEFSRYEKVFEHVLTHVKAERNKNKEKRTRENWWLYKRSAPDMRLSIKHLHRYLATPRVSKFRVFTWVAPVVMCDDGIYLFARSDDYFFGVLHSRIHEVWVLRLGTRLETRPRYTPTTCFETFPFPECGVRNAECGMEEEKSLARHAKNAKESDSIQNQQSKIQNEIAEAAKELDQLRNNWLNPPEWTKEDVLEFPGSVDGPWARYIDPTSRRSEPPGGPGIGTVRYPRIVPRDEECARKLKKRTLTNLYNERPAWLDLAHKKLDEAVFAAYGWGSDLSDEEILERLLALNLDNSGQ
ncbi:MAG: DNA methyltransferase [Planctomycetota bacterium]